MAALCVALPGELVFIFRVCPLGKPGCLAARLRALLRRRGWGFGTRAGRIGRP